AGEIVGVAGVEGSGLRELLLVLAGIREADAGDLRLPARVSFIASDRLRDAIVAEFTLAENVALRDAGARRGFMDWPSVVRHTADLLREYGIVPQDAAARAGALSGGNQQRLVVARELAGQVDLLVADNPTRGLDLRATEFVHSRLRFAARSGT